MPTDQKLKAQTVLEINDSHAIAEKIKKLYKEDKDELKKYSEVLYAQARLIEGLPVENQSEISNLICEIIAKWYCYNWFKKLSIYKLRIKIAK